MPEKQYGLVLFNSTNLALKGERALKTAGVVCAVIPTPVEFTSGCGISLLVDREVVKDARHALEGCGEYTLVDPYARRRER